MLSSHWSFLSGIALSSQKPCFLIPWNLAFKDLGLTIVSSQNYQRGKFYKSKENRPWLYESARLGHPILRNPAEEVPISLIQSNEIQRIISDMHETVLDADGAGLAAPQVFESKQIVLLNLDDENGMQVWINPKITPLTGRSYDWI